MKVKTRKIKKNNHIPARARHPCGKIQETRYNNQGPIIKQEKTSFGYWFLDIICILYLGYWLFRIGGDMPFGDTPEHENQPFLTLFCQSGKTPHPLDTIA